jgi:hypothetical protein
MASRQQRAERREKREESRARTMVAAPLTVCAASAKAVALKCRVACISVETTHASKDRNKQIHRKSV